MLLHTRAVYSRVLPMGILSSLLFRLSGDFDSTPPYCRCPLAHAVSPSGNISLCFLHFFARARRLRHPLESGAISLFS